MSNWPQEMEDLKVVVAKPMCPANGLLGWYFGIESQQDALFRTLPFAMPMQAALA